MVTPPIQVTPNFCPTQWFLRAEIPGRNSLPPKTHHLLAHSNVYSTETARLWLTLRNLSKIFQLPYQKLHCVIVNCDIRSRSSSTSSVDSVAHFYQAPPVKIPLTFIANSEWYKAAAKLLSTIPLGSLQAKAHANFLVKSPVQRYGTVS